MWWRWLGQCHDIFLSIRVVVDPIPLWYWLISWCHQSCSTSRTVVVGCGYCCWWCWVGVSWSTGPCRSIVVIVVSYSSSRCSNRRYGCNRRGGGGGGGCCVEEWRWCTWWMSWSSNGWYIITTTFMCFIILVPIQSIVPIRRCRQCRTNQGPDCWIDAHPCIRCSLLIFLLLFFD